MADNIENEIPQQPHEKGKGRTEEAPLQLLPPGWEQRVTDKGERYYLDHNTRSTAWTLPLNEDDRASPSELSSASFPRLPPGWEKRITLGGRTYYIDHNTCSTTWALPLDDEDQVSLSERTSGYLSEDQEQVNKIDEQLSPDNAASQASPAGLNEGKGQGDDESLSDSSTQSSSDIPLPPILDKGSEDRLWESFGVLLDRERENSEKASSVEGPEWFMRLKDGVLRSVSNPPEIPALTVTRNALSSIPSHKVRAVLFIKVREKHRLYQMLGNQPMVDAAMKLIAEVLGSTGRMVFESARKASEQVPIVSEDVAARLHHDLRNSGIDTIVQALGSVAATLWDTTEVLLRAGDTTSLRPGDDQRYCDMAIEIAGKAALLLPEASPGWWYLVYHAARLHDRRFSLSGLERDLHLAFRLVTRALERIPEDHQLYKGCLDLIGRLYSSLWVDGGGDSMYLTEALRLARGSLSDPAVESDLGALAVRMSHLGDSLIKQYLRSDKVETLDEALSILERVDKFESQNAVLRAELAYNLGRGYLMRFEIRKSPLDLDKGVENHLQATQMLPRGHPSCGYFCLSLISAYRKRYDELSSNDDLMAAVCLAEDALPMANVNERTRAILCIELGDCLKKVYQKTAENMCWERSVRLYEAARRSPSVPLMGRLCASIFAGYLLIHKQRWSEALEAFISAVDSLEEIATTTITREDQQNFLEKFGGVSATAAAVALESEVEPWMALQILERGRGVMLNISLSRQSDISEVKTKNPALYEEYTQLRTTLYSRHSTNDTPGGHEYGAASMHLNIREHQRKIQQLEERIQQELGPDVFHRLIKAEDFQQLAIPGPVVAFNTTNFRSDAFIITDKGVKSLPLPELKLEKLEEYMTLLVGPEAVIEGSEETRRRRNEKLGTFLEWLWDHAVLPVLKDLTIYCPDPPAQLPRIWWVASGLLGLVPLHAAGRPGKLKQSTSSHVVSSYIPTLRALSRARKRSATLPCFGHRALIVTMPETKGMGDLKTFEDEASIKLNLPAGVTPAPLNCPSKAQLLEHLGQSSAVFFSCHGEVDPIDPANSGLLLREGPDDKAERFTFRDLSNCETKLGKLACLLACSTATSANELLVEEMLHVVSGFQLAGFPHVIGSLWPVDDTTTNQVLKVFMKHLAETSGDDEAIARALHSAVKTQRIKAGRLSMNVISWAPFIHFGC